MSNLADIPIITRKLFRLNHACINAAQPDSRAAKLPDERNQVLIGFAGKHHLHDFDGFVIRIAQAVDEPRGNMQTFQHTADFGAAPMHQNNVNADQLQQDNIAHHCLFQHGMNHCIAAVFDDHCFSVVFLDIRQSCCQHLRLYAVYIHFFHNLSPYA